MTIIFPQLGKAGRLGNCLFQIASTVGIADTLEDNPRFPADWEYRPYLSIPDDYFGEQVGIDATKFVPYMDSKCQVYLQDYNLFHGISGHIHTIFHPSELAWDILMEQRNRWVLELAGPVVSVHVRRGDNVTHPQGYHPLRSVDYYKRALEQTPADASVLVFSDDIAWCRDNVPSICAGREVYFYEGIARPREYEDRAAFDQSAALDWIDLQLGAAISDYVVMSNSTYSWWMAYLASPTTKVFMPNNWFGHHLQYIDTTLLQVPGWTVVHDDTQGGI